MGASPLPFQVHHDPQYFQGIDLIQYQKLETSDPEVYVHLNDHFVPLAKVEINPRYRYEVLILHSPHRALKSDYNDRYLKYYDYAQMQSYLQSIEPRLKSAGYVLQEIGTSVDGRLLHVISPKEISKTKKPIVFVTRQHGDEGTANWIMEGFINSFLDKSIPSWHQEFQLILFPMANPDGVEKKIRFNSRGKDLNRTWRKDQNYLLESHEIGQIHKKMDELVAMTAQTPEIILDMHGSFTEDFIYQVYRDFIDPDYFNHQTQVITVLGKYDIWQNGRGELSNGDPKMLRISMAQGFHYNALTHETPRDIPIRNPQGRSLETLKQQGTAIYRMIDQVY